MRVAFIRGDGVQRIADEKWQKRQTVAQLLHPKSIGVRQPVPRKPLSCVNGVQPVQAHAEVADTVFLKNKQWDKGSSNAE